MSRASRNGAGLFKMALDSRLSRSRLKKTKVKSPERTLEALAARNLS